MSTNPIFTTPAVSNPFNLANGGIVANPVFADIDGDGDLDAFIGNYAPVGVAEIRFFRNTGGAANPVFTAETDNFGLVAAGSIASPAFADIDGDGDLDAFVGGGDGDTRFFRNIGGATNPSFSAEVGNFGLTDVGTFATPTFADIDGDGDLDVFVGNQLGVTLFFRNTGGATSPSFSTETNFGLADVGYHARPTFADIDGDGDLDAFIGVDDGGTLFFRNIGTTAGPSFNAEANFGLTNVGALARPTFADIDGDGDLDAFIGNYDGDTLFFLNTQPGVRLSQTGGTAVAEGGATDTYTIVLNTQPTADVTITLDTTNNQVTVNQASLTFTPDNWDTPRTVTVTAVDDTLGEGAHRGVILHTVTSADNGYNGIAAGKLQVGIADNDLPVSRPRFETQAVLNPFNLTKVGASASPVFADIDGDGDLDAFVGSLNGSTQFFRNTGDAGNPQFSADNNVVLAAVGGSANPAFADIDGDGDLDAFVGVNNGETRFSRNVGTATNPDFSIETNNFGLTVNGNYAAPVFADIDGDSDLDAFVGNGDGRTLFFRNTGTVTSPRFIADDTVALAAVGGFAAPNFADIDGDGDLDAFIGVNDGNTQFFRNTGTAASPNFVIESGQLGIPNVSQYANPAFADIDGDGDLDAFVGNVAGDTLFFLNIQGPGISLTQTGGNTAVSEGGGGDTYQIVLDSQPTADVTITLNTTNNQVTVDQASLTFTPSNWATPQSVIVSAVNDGVGEGPHRGVILHAVTSADSDYNGLALGNVQVGVADNDLPATAPFFNPPTANPFGLSPSGGSAAASFADIDGDGDLDAFVGNYSGDLVFFKNNGTATQPSFAAGLDKPFGFDATYHAAPTFADIDGDGDLDAFIGERYDLFRFYQNTGSATSPDFAAVVIKPFGLTGTGGYAKPSFADLDNDGDFDALIGNSNGELLFYENIGTSRQPGFATARTNPFGLSDVGNRASPSFVDVDGDGDWDVLVGNQDGNTLLFKNIGGVDKPKFAAKINLPFGLADVGNSATPTFADIDGDGDLDGFIGHSGFDLQFFLNQPPKPGVIISQTNGGTAVAEGGATDTYSVVLNTQPTADVIITLDTTNKQVSVANTALTFTAANWNIPQTVTVAAINDTQGEGKHQGVIKHTAASADGAYNGLAVNSVQVTITDNDLAKGVPNFIFKATNPFGLTNASAYTNNPTFADIDADGDSDVFVGTFKSGLMFFKNNGTVANPVYAAGKLNPFKLTTAGDYSRPAFADMDGDGDLDAFIGEDSGGTFFYQNIGTAQNAVFAAKQKNPFGIKDVGFNASASLADIDGDGRPDLFLGSSAGTIRFHKNISQDGAVAFEASVSNPFGLSGAGAYSRPTFADVDGDGDLDAYVGNSNEIRFFENTGSATNPVFAAAVSNPFGLSSLSTGYPKPTFADIDADGDLDALVGNSNGDTLFFLHDKAPTLTAFTAAVDKTNEDTPVEIRLAEMKARGNEADDSGTVTAFVIKAISSGSLKIGATAATATAWTPGSNDTVDAGHSAFWQGKANANGLLAAFTAVAKDNNGTESATPIAAKITVTAVNDAPAGANKIITMPEDKAYVFKTADFGFTDPNDNPPNNLQAVKITGLPTDGTLKLNGVAVSAGQLVSVAAITNGQLRFTPDVNDNGNNYAKIAFQVQDNGGVANGGNNLDPTANTLTFNVTPVNDLPTGAVKITGQATQGKTLTASNTLADVDGLGVITYTWKAGTTVLATGATYTLKAGDVGDKITVTAGYTDKDGNNDSKTSAATDVIGVVKNGTAKADTLSGTAGNDILNGLGGDDSLNGGNGNDVLNGGAGKNTLVGGAGNDSYFVSSSADVVTEANVAGSDTLNASITINSLAANVENLILTGTAAIDGSGNGFSNNITGNVANNVLVGGLGNDSLNAGKGDDTLVGGRGNDTLTGGAGKDVFRLDAALSNNLDKITDFLVADDSIQLENAVFTQLTVTGVLKAANFKLGPAAADGNDFIIYDKTTGGLFYDADGNGAGVAVQVAVLGVNLALSNADFVVV